MGSCAVGTSSPPLIPTHHYHPTVDGARYLIGDQLQILIMNGMSSMFSPNTLVTGGTNTMVTNNDGYYHRFRGAGLLCKISLVGLTDF